ncbi:hypothetical protein EYC80_005914 [Monilinia laxa]|uniref:Uncharacterized protein n=1 Tax=Monilinia laxa TaxID=61186 RepID=A0A5N6KFJ2_MONLA|nr:hypothetical protein EYC80_005914 [Monilinia laxa]
MDLLLFFSLKDSMKKSQTIAYQQPGNDICWPIEKHSQSSERAWGRESTVWFCALKSLKASKSRVRSPKKLFMKFALCSSSPLPKHAKPNRNLHRSYAQSTKHQRHIR